MSNLFATIQNAMQFEEYEIITITPEVTDVFLVRLKPKKKKYVSAFIPGQFYHVRNPHYWKPHETRQFSVVTTPKVKEYIEFCVKTYGPWTKALLKKKRGESVWLFGPMGQFILQKKTSDIVFIAGGVGITPILSIIQSLHEKGRSSLVTLIYANKSSQTILKKTHIENLFQTKLGWKFISLISQTDIVATDERRGRITEAFLKEEVDLKKHPVFFICGSKRFTENIRELLHTLKVPESRIKQEVFLPPFPPKTK